jgi:small subunit ribosomal protein S21
VADFVWQLDRKRCRHVKYPLQVLSNTKEDGERMAIVTVNQGESIESALRRFKRKVMTEEIIKDAKKHAFFIPPGQKAKLKSALARKRNKKKGRMRTPPRD